MSIPEPDDADFRRAETLRAKALASTPTYRQIYCAALTGLLARVDPDLDLDDDLEAVNLLSRSCRQAHYVARHSLGLNQTD